ncbi:MAG: TGS domain-containing protein [Flavobacteriales bacterium]
MINISLHDGSVREVETGTTNLEMATSISKSFARNVLSAELKGAVRDPSPI